MEILSHKEHREWPVPNRSWRFYNQWNKVLFLHYKVDCEELKKHLPKDLELDTFENEAWVSLVVFDMVKCRLRPFPAFSPISDFKEVNIRTYTKDKGRRSVYFLDIKVDNWVSAIVAKACSGLPYEYAKIYQDENYKLVCPSKKYQIELTYSIKEQITEKSRLDLWLTERYGLNQLYKGQLFFTDVHHIPWELYKVNLKRHHVKHESFPTIFDKPPVLAHYSKGVEVIAWTKKQG